MKESDLNLLEKILWLRMAQVIINELCKSKSFLVPIHLALGHETLAVAVDKVMKQSDKLFLSHRNVHYNLIKMGTLKEELDEYYLKESGIAGGRLGSMNLFNQSKNITYTSNILGNNLPVGCGYALGNKVKNEDGVTFIVTGDGAVEEGSFYESILFLASHSLPVVIIIEDNDWSLATQKKERRSNIDFSKLANSFSIDYSYLQGNDPFLYRNEIELIRNRAFINKKPAIIEVKLTTLGYWHMDHADFPEGKFINYHAGSAPNVYQTEYPLLEDSDNDPLFILKKYLPIDDLKNISKRLAKSLKEEIK